MACVSHEQVARAVNELECWSGGGGLQVTSVSETEWHQVFVVNNDAAKMVVSALNEIGRGR